jgi:DNA repair exonuclease SbcCD ATPase subunit
VEHAELYRVASELDELQGQADRLDTENTRLRDQVAELEGWYRLLQADHTVLQTKAARSSRRVTELQAESNRLASDNQDLQHLVVRYEEVGRGFTLQERTFMARISDYVSKIRRHRWATAAAVAIATLVARDPSIRGALGSALDETLRFARIEWSADRSAASSGFLRYAALIQSRDQAEQARRDYNERESTLKGDALLEAQDRLRAAKSRYRQAKLAFWPELAKQCRQAGVPLPREAAEALVVAKNEME